MVLRTHSKQCDFIPRRFQNKKGSYKNWVYGSILLFSGALFALIFIQQTYAAIFSFSQTSWVGGSTVTTATHANNRTGWTEYASQSGLIAGADVRLLPTTYTFTDDGTTTPQGLASGGGFTNGTHSTTLLSGSGGGASVGIGSATFGTGGTVTTSGTYTIHTFTSGGNFVLNTPADIEYLTVGGGGGGGGGSGSGVAPGGSGGGISGGAGGTAFSSGSGGGGGGGGIRRGTFASLGSGTYPVTVGAGGAGGVQGVTIIGAAGSASIFSTSESSGSGAVGGGGGAGGLNTFSSGLPGGSGTTSSISGVATFYGGGGGGAGGASAIGGAGGAGGGGAGGITNSNSNGVVGSANTGGGGGGAVSNTMRGGNGGSGIVILRYAPSSGTFTSAVINTGAQSAFTTFTYATTLNGQTITMDVRAGNTATPDGTWTAWQTGVTSGGSIAGLSGNRYIQYRANLLTSNLAVTPTLDSVSIGYSQYITGELTSSVYDSNSFANLIARVSWTESGESVTEHTKLQIRSSADNITWSNWCGFDDCSGGTYFDVSRNGVVLNTGHPLLSGNDDRYFQYKATLVSGGALTPILTGVTVQYVVNSTPEFDPNYPLTGDGGVSAMQNADGSVTINYSIIDNDTTQGSASAGFVTPTFQYSLDNGSTWAGIDSSAMNTGDTDNKAVQELTYTPYTATWHASTTLLGVYNNTVKVRVTINDNEIANSVAYGLSATITLDTKAPTLGAYPIRINASPSPALVTLSATDDSTFSMKVGRVPDLSDATYEAYTNTKELILSSGNTVYAQFMDAVGNETAIVSLATIGSPTNIFYQDTSDVTTSEWREFFAWGVVQNPPSGFKRYNVMRSVDGGAFTLLTTITNRAINYYVDSSLNSGSSYSYQVSSEDNDGNISFFSPASEPHTPVGFGGSDLAGPTLNSVVVSDVSAVEATITWTTNKLSNSTVYYSATSSYPGAEIVAYETSAGVPSMVTTNSVVLSGLTPGTQYFFLTASADASNNIGISSLPSYAFTTLAGPVISNVTPAEVYDSEATITWNTNTRTDATVVFSTSPDISNPIQISGTGDFSRNHRVTLTGLIHGTDYYYYVKSTDESGNTTIDKNVIDGVVEYFTFHTSYDTEPPIITDVDTSLVGETGATITWTTDKPATSWIDWGTDTSLGSSTVEDTVYSTRHSVTLNNLISNYPYFYRVNSNSRSGFLATDDNNGNEYTFTTSIPTTVSGGTRDNRDLTTPEISDIIVTAITDTSAKIKFTTSKVANGLVQYGLTTKYTDEVGDPEQFSEKHSVLLTGLSPGTTYNFKIFANDIYENEGISRNSTLTTTMGGEVVADPVINDGTEDVGTSTPEVTLFEKVKSASSAMLEDLLAAFAENPNLSEISEEMLALSFKEISSKVTEPPIISGTTVSVSVNSTSAVIQWTTDKEANALVSYASAKEYNTGKDPYTTTTGFPDVKQTDHKIVLDNLTPATTYHFKVRSESILGAPSISDDGTFTTTALLPDIKDAKFDTIGENSVTLSWNTELPTMTAIELENTETGETRKVEDKSYLENHRTTLDNLEFSTAYVATLIGLDTSGNTSAPFAMPFSTALSSGAPLISDVKINTSLIPGRVQMAQTIISWKTSKPATSKVYYGTGGTTEPTQSLPQNKTLTRDHVVITTTLQPGMVYKIRAESEDPAGNATSSSLYTILTPTTQGSVFDIIASNLSGMFGFLGGKK